MESIWNCHVKKGVDFMKILQKRKLNKRLSLGVKFWADEHLLPKGILPSWRTGGKEK